MKLHLIFLIRPYVANKLAVYSSLHRDPKSINKWKNVIRQCKCQKLLEKIMKTVIRVSGGGHC